MACIAMLTGRTYAEASALFPGTDFNDTGLVMRRVDEMLARIGYAVGRRFRSDAERQGYLWPPEPFAEMHLCDVTVAEDSPCDHYVVMDAYGQVYDPLTPDVRTLFDYHRVSNVAAIVRFGEPWRREPTVAALLARPQR